MADESRSTVPQWEKDIGLPQFTDPFIQQYLAGRDALIEQEERTNTVAPFIASLTPMAQEACAIVRRIQQHENKTIWAHTLENKEFTIYPGMPFTLARPIMEKSMLWKIIKKLPKGSNLHAHFDAMVDIPWLVEQALETEGFAMKSSEPLSSPEAMTNATISFQYIGEESKTSIYEPTYKASFVSVSHAASEFPGGMVGFKQFLLEKMTITRAETLSSHFGIDDIWRKFQTTFPLIGSILMYEPILRKAIRRILLQLVNDGVRWVEFRMAFVAELYMEGKTTPEESYEGFFRAVDEELTEFKASDEGKTFWGARFIWTPIRSFDSQLIIESMQDCIEMKKLYPHLICGFDLVGQEDIGKPHVELLPEIFWFKKRCAEEGLNIPFFFHAGETLLPETSQNLYDAILLGTRRIGHGFSLYKHPLLTDLVLKKSICIESCPLSHEILRLTGNISQHPLPALLSRGIKVVLGSDDPAILGGGWPDMGSSGEFWSCVQGMGIGLEGIGSMAENSIRYSAFDPNDGNGEHDQTPKEWLKDVQDGLYGQGIRAAKMRDWRMDWEEFCTDIVMEYAADWADLGDDE